MTHIIEFDNLQNGDIVRLEYQHIYNRNTKEFNTTTTEQRPDIVVTIRKPDGFVLTYLYDAKYRVQDDKNDGELDEGADIDYADYPLPDAINQMHRYRDAIYYSMKEDVRPRGKEVIGGYILFPGRTEGIAIENRYFYKSIEKVNIGAFPLLPAGNDNTKYLVQCDLLEKHLTHIILENSVYAHIKDSIPQKGLHYSSKTKDEKNVYVGYVRSNNPEYELFLGNKATSYYSGHIDMKDADLQSLEYLLPLIGGKVVGVYEIEAITFKKLRRIRPLKEGEDGNELRIVFSLGTFIPLSNGPISYNNRLHNNETYSYDGIMEKIKHL